MKPKTPIYLDYAAATPMDPRVLAAMQPWLTTHFHNPSSLYAPARESRAALDEARHRVAMALGAKTSEVIFTAGATESINLALFGVARLHPGAAVVASAIEHEAVLACLAQLEQDGHPTSLVGVKPSGEVDPAAIAQAITDQTVLVSVMYANNEIGTIQPLSQLARAVAQVRADREARGIELPIYLHTDASQAGLLDLQVSRLAVDLLTLSAAKLYGPKQTAALYIRTGTQLAPLVVGGGQERGLRSGTESVASAVGLATALELTQSERKVEVERLQRLRNRLEAGLLATLPQLVVHATSGRRLPNFISCSLPGASGEAAVLYLDQAGIQAGTGSACSIGSAEPSQVLMALGLSSELAQSSLRFTLGRFTTEDDIKAALEAIPVALRLALQNA